MRIAELAELDRVLVVGSFLRKEHPLLAQRLRQSAKRGARISLIHSAADDSLIKLSASAIAAPSQLPLLLAQVLKAVCELKGAVVDAALSGITVNAQAQHIAQSLVSGSKAGVVLGNFAQQHPQAAQLHTLGWQLANVLGGKLGVLGEAANSVGAHVARSVPANAGLNASAMLRDPRRAYLVLGAEPELDCADGAQALTALRQAASVIVLAPFKSQAALDYADVLLPIAPFSETSGTFINMEGRVQGFYAAVKPQGEARPAWKVLRVLGNLLGLEGFDYNSSEEVRAEALCDLPLVEQEFVSGLDNAIEGVSFDLPPAGGSAIERVADVPIYCADTLVRHAPSLQAARDSAVPALRMNAAMLTRLNLVAGELVKVGADDTARITLQAELDVTLPDGVVRVSAACPQTVALGPMFTRLMVEKA